MRTRNCGGNGRRIGRGGSVARRCDRLCGGGVPEVAEESVHIDLGGLRGMRMRWRDALVAHAGMAMSAGLGLLEGGQQCLQRVVIELANHVCEVGRRGRGLGLRWRSSGLGVLVWVAGGRCLGLIRLAVVGGWVRRPGLGKMRCGLKLGFLSQYEFGGHGGVDLLIELETDAAGSGSDEDLDRNLALRLGGIVQVDDGMNPFHDLALHHRVPRKAGVDVHDIGLQASVMQRALDPGDKVSRDLLGEEDLHVRNVGSETARDIKTITVGRSSAVRAGTPTSI